MQLVAIGFLLCGEAGDTVLPQSVLAWRWKSGEDLIPLANSVGLVLLWVSALLTLYTGWDYFRAGMRHLIDD